MASAQTEISVVQIINYHKIMPTMMNNHKILYNLVFSIASQILPDKHKMLWLKSTKYGFRSVDTNY